MMENPWGQLSYIGDPALATSLLHQLIGNVEIQDISSSELVLWSERLIPDQKNASKFFSFLYLSKLENCVELNVNNFYIEGYLDKKDKTTVLRSFSNVKFVYSY